MDEAPSATEDYGKTSNGDWYDDSVARGALDAEDAPEGDTSLDDILLEEGPA